MKYSDWQARVELRPAFVRAGQAALLLGSGILVADFVEAGWLKSVVSGHRMVLYSYKDLERCVGKLEAEGDPAPDGRTDRPRDPGLTLSGLPTEGEPSFAGQLRSMVVLRPLLLRPDQAAGFLGSVELLDEFRAAGWLTAVVSRTRTRSLSYQS